ncbi:MAG: hypothetical protein M3044_16545 [Thermoproteota archaeon]|nr:hypothetical protein [Thermoproteota archaeon]
MYTSVRYIFVCGFAAIALVMSACSGNGGLQPNTSAPGTLATNQGAPANDLAISQGRDFGTLVVDPNAPAPQVDNQYLHINRLPGQVLSPPTDSSSLDLIDHGGVVTHGATQYNIYVNCASSCWGVPAGFQVRLGLSGMMLIVNQYGAAGNYDYSGAAQVTYSNAHTLYDVDMWKLIRAYINKFHTTTGYAAIYNVFLNKGIDECVKFRGTTQYACYSPDVPAKFKFCAYHSSADFLGIGHVLYTVEPYQDISACHSPPPTPNSSLADSTDSTLSHEVFETITDPDGHSWFNQNGDEIGDICRPFYQIVSLHGHQYKIQGEYSNRISACAW